jgi:hypothetical protein
MFGWVDLLARRDYAALAEREGSGRWTSDRLVEAAAGYWEAHDAIGIDGDARAATRFQLAEGDPEGADTADHGTDAPPHPSDAGYGGATGSVETGGRPGWTVRQGLADPAGDDDWAIHARVDLDASDAEGRAVITLREISPAV